MHRVAPAAYRFAWRFIRWEALEMFKRISAGTKSEGQRLMSGTFVERTSIVWKTAFASAAAWELARMTGSNHPYLAPLTSILCLQVSIGQSLRYALYRSLGTVIGVLLIGFFTEHIPVTAWALCLLLIVSSTLMKLIGAKDQLNHQVALSILFVLYFETQSAGYAWDRAKDTLIGALVGGLFVTLIFPTNELRKAEQALKIFTEHFAQVVTEVAEALRLNLLYPSEKLCAQVGGVALDFRLRTMLDECQETVVGLARAEQGLPFNPYVNRSRAEQLDEQISAIRQAFIHFVTLTETFCDGMSAKQREEWSKNLDGLSADIQAFLRMKIPESPPTATENSSYPLNRSLHSKHFNADVSNHELQMTLRALRRPF